MEQIIACIPNFSEGQRLEVVEAIVQAIASVDGLAILHQTSDKDHNRSVVTFAGQPDAVLEGAFRGIEAAARLIDMDAQQGQHPRIGAADVVPLIPIRGISLEECALLARSLASRVGELLKLPVYCYEAAAFDESRRNLAHLRQGQYEGLKAAILTDPARRPDYGPAMMSKAGACVIGAREALIAFNVFLNTTELHIARDIAQKIRASGDGLPYVKALGLMVDGRAQVSMNLTNYRKTPIHRVVEFIRREAAQYGCMIYRCELIGLVPQDALFDAAAWYLQMHDFTPARVLDVQLSQRLPPDRGDA